MSQLRLLKDKRFYAIFWTQFTGAFNDNFFKNALVILINYRAQQIMGISPPQMVALAGGIFILPFFLFSATSGQIADKFEKTKIITFIKFIEILIMILAFVGFVYEHFIFLLIVLFLMGTHSAFFGPVKYSILPQLLGDDEILTGNALVEAGTFLAILLGTICGGVLINIEFHPNLVVGTGLLIMALLGFWVSRKVVKKPAVDPNVKIEWNPITPTYKVFQLARQNSSVFFSIYAISWFWFFGAVILSLCPIYCKDVLNAGPSVVTYFLALFSIGIGAGSLGCEKIVGKKIDLGLVVFGTLGMSIFATDLFLVGAPHLSANVGSYLGLESFFGQQGSYHISFDFFMMSVFMGFFVVPLYTLLQVRAKPAIRSRIIAANNVMNSLFMVISAVGLMQLLKLKMAVPQIFLVLAILNIFFMSYIFFKEPEFVRHARARFSTFVK